jgi:DeoR family deoxyribose operon repressor
MTDTVRYVSLNEPWHPDRVRQRRPVRGPTGEGLLLDRNQRIKHIVDVLRLKTVATIKQLSRRLEVSEMTVRRDLNYLADEGVVELIPGGAIFRNSSDSDSEKYLITHEGTRNVSEKMKIGRKAASLIEPNDTVALDVGSTTEYLAKFIPEEYPVTVLCYALNILVEIYRKKNCIPIFAGGYFHDNTLMFSSPGGLELIRSTRSDKAFISAAGVHDDLGVTCANAYEIETKRAVMASSKTRILLADCTKFGKTRYAHFADLRDFDIIITDSGLSQEQRDVLEGFDVSLITV